MDLHKITTDAHLRAQRLAAVREFPSAMQLSLVLDRLANGFHGAGLRRDSGSGARLTRGTRALEAILLLICAGFFSEASALCAGLEQLARSEGRIATPELEGKAAAAVLARVVETFGRLVKSCADEAGIPVPGEVTKLLAAVGAGGE